MDPAEISEYEAFLTDENLVYLTSIYTGSDDWQTNSDRPYLRDLFADVRARYDLYLAENWPPSGPSDDQSPLQTLSSTLEPINQSVPTAQPPTYLNPGVSQDDIVIRQRGRRRLPVTWSPDIDFKSIAFKSTERTPPKIVPTPQTVSTTRKRLTFLERNPMSPDKMAFSDVRTPEKFKLTSPVKETPPCKRPRLESTPEEDFKSPIDVALKGLSPAQLIDVIKAITNKHPEIENEIRTDMPKPDLAPLEERLKYLKCNIFKNMPTSRLSSKTDSLAYSRVATHLGAFKNCVIDQGKTLVESQHWDSVVKYVFLAWSYVRGMPVWDNQPHNTARNQCFKALINFCMSALKKGSFDRETLIDVYDKLQGISADAEEAQTCLNYVQSQIQD